jgi:hypothetical protein
MRSHQAREQLHVDRTHRFCPGHEPPALVDTGRRMGRQHRHRERRRPGHPPSPRQQRRRQQPQGCRHAEPEHAADGGRRTRREIFQRYLACLMAMLRSAARFDRQPGSIGPNAADNGGNGTKPMPGTDRAASDRNTGTLRFRKKVSCYDTRTIPPAVLGKDPGPRRLRRPEPALHGDGLWTGPGGWHHSAGLWDHLGCRSRTVPYTGCPGFGVTAAQGWAGRSLGDPARQAPSVVAPDWRLTSGAVT